MSRSEAVDQRDSKKPEDGIVRVSEYRDDLHAESLDDIQVGEYGYKYRVIGGIMLPPLRDTGEVRGVAQHRDPPQ